MNFKKILSLVGVLTVVVPTSMAVVSCGNPQDNDKIKADAIVDMLKHGIDGSSLTTKSTKKAALELMQRQDGIKDIAKLSFVNAKDAETTLIDGDNNLNINIEIGAIKLSTDQAKVTKVNIGNDTKSANAIKTLLAQGIDGSTLTNAQTGNDALKLIEAGAKTIDSAAVVSFSDSKDAKKKLTSATNKFSVSVKVRQALLEKINVAVNDVNKNVDTAAVKTVKAALEITTGIDGAKLTSNDTGASALALMKHMDVVTKNKAELSFVTASDANKKLTETGPNTFVVIITIGTAHDNATVIISNINKNTNAAIIKAISETVYDVSATDGDQAAAIKNKINADFIKDKLSTELKTNFIADHFKFGDITVKGQALKDDNLKTINNIDAQITYSYAGETNLATKLTIEVAHKYSDHDIKEYFRSIITTDKPLAATCVVNDDKAVPIKTIADYLIDPANDAFSAYLVDLYRIEFNYKHLGVYDQDMYGYGDSTAILHNDFFNTVGTKHAYVYINYNSTGDATKDGLYVPIIVTVTAA